MDELDLLFQRIIRRIQSINVLAAGMSGFQQGGTSQRRSARLGKKGEVIVQNLTGVHSNEGWLTSSRLKGDVIVLSSDKHSSTHVSPRDATGSIFSDVREATDTESEKVSNTSMAPSTWVKYSNSTNIMDLKKKWPPSWNREGVGLQQNLNPPL